MASPTFMLWVMSNTIRCRNTSDDSGSTGLARAVTASAKATVINPS